MRSKSMENEMALLLSGDAEEPGSLSFDEFFSFVQRLSTSNKREEQHYSEQEVSS
jgi:hypothetical protein